MRRLFYSLFGLGMMWLVASPGLAQTNLIATVPSSRAIALSSSSGISVGEVSLPGDSLFVDFNPVQANRFARIDYVGLLRFVPQGSSSEGVYTFAPFFDGYEAPSAAENRLLINEVRWSPAGDKLAFRINNPSLDDAAHGAWFWQPAQDLPTDPSYQLIRLCPPYCELAGGQGGDAWRVTSLDWSSDNEAILVGLTLPNEGNRRALDVRLAQRDPQTLQPGLRPNALRYDYGHWSPDGQRIVVSGQDPNGRVVFGSINRDGTGAQLTLASDVGLAWVRDAVQNPQTGQLVMLGSQSGPGAALQLFNADGSALSDAIGPTPPTTVEWSPDRNAVRVVASNRTYIAQLDGSILDITDLVAGSPAVGWVNGALPANARSLPLPAPISEGLPQTAGRAPAEGYAVGQLLQVLVPNLPLHNGPGSAEAVITDLGQGVELIITGGPMLEGDVTWWRVQTVDHSGWLPETRDGNPTMGLVDNAVG